MNVSYPLETAKTDLSYIWKKAPIKENVNKENGINNSTNVGYCTIFSYRKVCQESVSEKTQKLEILIKMSDLRFLSDHDINCAHPILI
jgi:hypothetical protein